MKMRLVALVGLAIGFAVPTFAQEQNTVDPEVRQQIEAVMMRFDDAFNKSDAAAVAALFTEHAVQVLTWIWGAGATASGQEAIERRFRVQFPAPGKLSHKLLQVYAIDKDIENEICAISEFYHAYFQRKGYAVRIYVREGDTWKIRMEYAN
jgi:ketosteroid isomerase-like protein